MKMSITEWQSFMTDPAASYLCHQCLLKGLQVLSDAVAATKREKQHHMHAAQRFCILVMT